MSDFNENQNGVFGGIQFNGEENKSQENTSFFENTNQNESAANIFGVFDTNNAGSYNGTIDDSIGFQPIAKEKAIAKPGIWSKLKAFLFQEVNLTAPVKIELTPYQQRIEDEVNDFLHQEVSFKGIFNFFKGKK